MADPQIVRITESDGVDPYLIEEIIAESKRRLTEVPARFTDATVTVPAVAEWVRELVAGAVKARQDHGIGDPEVCQGRSLFLMGPVGTGKTWQAWGAIRALAVSGVRCNWQAWNVERMFGWLRPRDGFEFEPAISAIERAGLLLLDDLAATKSSAWCEAVIYRIVDYRNERILPTVITTNIGGRRPDGNQDRISEHVGERVASRLAQMCTTVPITGPDRRRS